MDDLIQSSISGSIGDVGRQIAEVDERLADLFGRIAEILSDEKRRRGESERDDKRTNERIVKGTFDRIGTGGEVNTIPFGKPGDCLKKCVAIAFGRLNTKYGFNQIVKKVTDYWFNCGKENCQTLIITYAWDITDFNITHKYAFDGYTSSENKDNIKHTVAIVLYGDYGYSLQYLR